MQFYLYYKYHINTVSLDDCCHIAEGVNSAMRLLLVVTFAALATAASAADQMPEPRQLEEKDDFLDENEYSKKNVSVSASAAARSGIILKRRLNSSYN